MKSNKQIINDLKELLAIVNDGKEGFETSSEATDKIELKGLFLRFSAQRALYASELKEHIEKHGGSADNENGGLLGAIHRTWIDIKQAMSSKEDKAILTAVINGEKYALDKYNRLIADYEDHADHIQLLRSQRDGIITAIESVYTMLSTHQH
jgi:uncharacterized protein (TIGR02284 family)